MKEIDERYMVMNTYRMRVRGEEESGDTGSWCTRCREVLRVRRGCHGLFVVRVLLKDYNLIDVQGLNSLSSTKS